MLHVQPSSRSPLQLKPSLQLRRRVAPLQIQPHWACLWSYELHARAPCCQRLSSSCSSGLSCVRSVLPTTLAARHYLS